MNPYVILLGIILILLAYILYTYFTASAATIAPNANLMQASPEIKTMVSPTSVGYAYGVWVYVNSWSNTNNHIIFSRQNNIMLRLDKNSPTLYCDIWMNSNTNSSNVPGAGLKWLTVPITSNFPIQKWTYVVVSVDGQFIDCYLDGKLVVSNQLYIQSSGATNVPAQPPDVASTTVSGVSVPGYSLWVGNSDTTMTNSTFAGWDALLAYFQRWTTPLDPQTVWTTYLKGNGQSNVFSTGYGVNMTVLKNNIQQGTYTVF